MAEAQPDLRAVVHSLLRANRELTSVNRELADAIEKIIGRDDPASGFVPTELQRAILEALKGKALRTDGLAAKVGDRRGLFKDPGALPELQEEGLVAHHSRLGYYRPDAPPTEIANTKPDVSP